VHRRKVAAIARLSLLGLIAASGLLLIWRTGVPSTEEMQAWADSAGAVGVAGFLAAYVVCSIVLLPKGVLSIVAGAVWGLAGGIAIVMVGATVGASAAFFIGRRLGREPIEQLAAGHLTRLDHLAARHGSAAVLVARLVPLVPFTVVNYASGVVGIRFAPYFWATAVGIVPGTASYVALGAYGTRPGSWEFVAAVVAFGVLTVAGVIASRRRPTARGAQEGKP